MLFIADVRDQVKYIDFALGDVNKKDVHPKRTTIILKGKYEWAESIFSREESIR